MAINNKKGLVEILTINGYDVIQIFKDSDYDRSEFLIVNSFEPPTVGGIQNTPYIQIIGWNITEILNNNVNANANMALGQIKTMLDKTKKEEIQFSHDFSWVYYKRS